MKCPKCGQKLNVPDLQTAPDIGPSQSADRAPSLLEHEDPFSLLGPAISDLTARDQAANEIRAEKAKKRDLQKNKQANRARYRPGSERELPEGSSGVATPQPSGRAHRGGPKLNDDGLVPFDSDHELSGASHPATEERDANLPSTRPESTAVGSSGGNVGQSVFDQDLPSLPELHADHEYQLQAPHKTEPVPEARGGSTGKRPQRRTAPAQPLDGLEDLDQMIPSLAAKTDPLQEADDATSAEAAQYRIVCRSCGTAQYVSPSAVGRKIKCPDCFLVFPIPPPPAGWQPGKRKKKPPLRTDRVLAPEARFAEDSSDLRKRERFDEMLEKAREEISDEEKERLYESDFDTAGFVQRTFGFLRDPMTMAQVVIYGLVFAILFAMAQFGMNDTESHFGRGLLMLTVILVPITGILFALPMLSGGMALIEAVANKQRFVREIPAFSLFDNVADLGIMAIALGFSVIPGFLVGSVLAGETEAGSGFFKIAGMVVSGFALFPIFLLSMMDNGSWFSPISKAVIRSFYEATESWGAYYLKSLVGAFIVLVFWLLLLGGSPILAGVAGFMLPLFLFFICQQIGALADSIADHLSFEFMASPSDETIEEESAFE